jgi:hypothetical protein
MSEVKVCGGWKEKLAEEFDNSCASQTHTDFESLYAPMRLGAKRRRLR